MIDFFERTEEDVQASQKSHQIDMIEVLIRRSSVMGKVRIKVFLTDSSKNHTSIFTGTFHEILDRIQSACRSEEDSRNNILINYFFKNNNWVRFKKSISVFISHSLSVRIDKAFQGLFWSARYESDRWGETSFAGIDHLLSERDLEGNIHCLSILFQELNNAYTMADWVNEGMEYLANTAERDDLLLLKIDKDLIDPKLHLEYDPEKEAHYQESLKRGKYVLSHLDNEREEEE